VKNEQREGEAKPPLKTRAKRRIRGFLLAVTNPRFLLCFGIGWMITNGWAYVLFGLGWFLKLEWMVAVAGGYLTLLWIPFTPEKIITVAIAIFLLKRLFPNDQKTLARLKAMTQTAKKKAKGAKERHREKQRAKKTEHSDM